MNKQEQIEEIQKIIGSCGSIKFTDLNCRTAPVTNYLGNGIVQLGETFNVQDVEVVNYKDNKELSSDFISYDELCDNCVDEIYHLIEEFNVSLNKVVDHIYGR